MLVFTHPHPSGGRAIAYGLHQDIRPGLSQTVSCVGIHHLHIRPACGTDAESINRIANWYIAHTPFNFDTEVWTLAARQHWLASFNQPKAPYTMLVGVCEDIVGFACNTQLRPKPAYHCSTETTIYLDPAHQAKGYGEQLYTALLTAVARAHFHRAYAIIALPNPASLSLHDKLGFTQVGLLDEIGKKFGRYHSVAWYQKIL